MDSYYYVVLDSLGEFVRAFKRFEDAQVFWIARGGSMGGWTIRKRVSKY